MSYNHQITHIFCTDFEIMACIMPLKTPRIYLCLHGREPVWRELGLQRCTESASAKYRHRAVTFLCDKIFAPWKLQTQGVNGEGLKLSWLWVHCTGKGITGNLFCWEPLCFKRILRRRQSHFAEKLAQSALAGNVYAFLYRDAVHVNTPCSVQLVELGKAKE